MAPIQLHKIFILVTGFFLITASLDAKVFRNMEEALNGVYPDLDVKKEVFFLTETQRAEVNKLTGFSVDQKVVTAYKAYQGENLEGYAYFDKHRVRTMPETLMIAVTPKGRVKAVEVLVFMEPEDYLPGKKWYAQFLDKVLGKNLQLKRDIQGITGATLTARATTKTVRKILAVHQVVMGSGAS